MEAAQELAARADSGVNTSTTPIVLITDSKSLRRSVHDGALPGVVGPHSVNSVHSAAAEFTSAVPHMPAYVELMLLGRARCLVYSGESTRARTWARRTARALGLGPPLLYRSPWQLAAMQLPSLPNPCLAACRIRRFRVQLHCPVDRQPHVPGVCKGCTGAGGQQNAGGCGAAGGGREQGGGGS
jgi:hypothetical protein